MELDATPPEQTSGTGNKPVKKNTCRQSLYMYWLYILVIVVVVFSILVGVIYNFTDQEDHSENSRIGYWIDSRRVLLSEFGTIWIHPDVVSGCTPMDGFVDVKFDIHRLRSVISYDAVRGYSICTGDEFLFGSDRCHTMPATAVPVFVSLEINSHLQAIFETEELDPNTKVCFAGELRELYYDHPDQFVAVIRVSHRVIHQTFGRRCGNISDRKEICIRFQNLSIDKIDP